MCLAIPGKVVSLSDTAPLERTARVDFGGLMREVSAACVPEATVGDYVLVHAGFALTIVDEAEANQLLAALAAAAPDELAAEGLA